MGWISAKGKAPTVSGPLGFEIAAPWCGWILAKT